MLKLFKMKTVILVVIITALLSCLAINLTSAKYYSEIIGSSSTQTAAFDVTARFTDSITDITLEEGDTTSYKELNFMVNGNSDVKISYDVVITLTSALPSSVILTVDGQEYKSVSNNKYTFAGGEIAPNDTLDKPHKLKIEATVFTDTLQIEGISVSVIATQVQPN